MFGIAIMPIGTKTIMSCAAIVGYRDIQSAVKANLGPHQLRLLPLLIGYLSSIL